MAGIQWRGGKCHGGTEAKARLRHDDKQERMVANHSNDDIDITRTPNNWSMRNESYAQKCHRYDKRIAEVTKDVRVSSGKNATVTMQSCVVYEPRELLSVDDLRTFFSNVWDIAGDLFGEENLIDMDVHTDEQHEYIDPDTHELVMSRIHGQLNMIPAVNYVVETKSVAKTDANGKEIPKIDPKTGMPKLYTRDDPTGRGLYKKGDVQLETKKERTVRTLPQGEYRLNAFEFSKRENIVAFNQAVQEMCVREFGVDYMTGEGTHKSRTVEQMKRESQIAAAECEVKVAEREAADARANAEMQFAQASYAANLALDMADERNEMIAEREEEEKKRAKLVRESTQVQREIDEKKRRLELYSGDSYIENGIEYYGLAGLTRRLGELGGQVVAKQEEYDNLNARIEQVERAGFERGKELLEMERRRHVRARAKANTAFADARAAKQVYENAADSIEGMSIEDVIRDMLDEAYEFTGPKPKSGIIGMEEFEKESPMHDVLGKVRSYFRQYESVGGDTLAQIIARRIRHKRMLQNADVRNDEHVRGFEEAAKTWDEDRAESEKLIEDAMLPRSFKRRM